MCAVFGTLDMYKEVESPACKDERGLTKAFSCQSTQAGAMTRKSETAACAPKECMC